MRRLSVRWLATRVGTGAKTYAKTVAAALCLSAAMLLDASAQVTDASSFVFDDSTVPSIRINLTASDFDALFAAGNQYSDEERPASFEFVRDGISIRVDSVGFRLRGNTSRDAAKKSFKVSFNTFTPGGEFHDLEKLNLNGEHNDPSIMRAKVSWDLFNAMGLPASRANHIDLFINGTYFGVYLNVEHVDEKFLTRHFGNSDGNLYKCLWPADLAYRGPGADAYRPVDESRRPYDLKLKDDDQLGYEDLAWFIAVVNTVDDAVFEREIEKVFEVNGFLRATAITVLLGSWD
ncbi:MAG: CotH kinase family protein, partial [Rhodothermales bacterium]|nr:CotH kinase family protein [Rhodothermales bacterium]